MKKNFRREPQVLNFTFYMESPYILRSDLI